MSNSSRGVGRAIFLSVIMIVSVLGATVAFSGAAAAENASVSYSGPAVLDIPAGQNATIDTITVSDADTDGDQTQIDRITIAGVEPNSDNFTASELESVSLKVGGTRIATNSSVSDLDVPFGNGSGTEFASGAGSLTASDVDSDGENELLLADGASEDIDVVATVTSDATDGATFEYATQIVLTGAFGGTNSPENFSGSLSDTDTNSNVDVKTLSVGDISTNHNFTGVVADEENLTINASGINVDGDTIDSGAVDIRIVSAEGTSIERSDVSVENGNATAEISTEEFDPETNTSAPATIVVEETGDNGVNGSVELVHEAKNPGEGFTLMSVPQPAEIEYQDADAIQQYNATAEKSKNLYPPAPERFDDSTDLHRGFWFEGGNDQARIGFDYDTSGRTTPGLVELNTGWHLASSNFDVSDSENKKIEKDITPVLDESTGISIFAGDQSQLLKTGDTVGEYDAYWVFVDETAQGTTRSTIAPEYDPLTRNTTLSN